MAIFILCTPLRSLFSMFFYIISLMYELTFNKKVSLMTKPTQNFFKIGLKVIVRGYIKYIKDS